jgi:hypothetical protein
VILSNFVKFDKIRLNSDWRGFCTVKFWKTENRLNLPINRTELAEIRFDSSKIRWNSRGYWSLKKNWTLTMQILKIWNNLFTKGLQIHSNFLSYLFPTFYKLWKIKFWYPFKCIEQLRFEKLFSPNFLEFTIVFSYFSRFFFKFSKISNFKLKISDF